jgi:hypothetical protein
LQGYSPARKKCEYLLTINDEKQQLILKDQPFSSISSPSQRTDAFRTYNQFPLSPLVLFIFHSEGFLPLVSYDIPGVPAQVRVSLRIMKGVHPCAFLVSIPCPASFVP